MPNRDVEKSFKELLESAIELDKGVKALLSALNELSQDLELYNELINSSK